MPSIFFLFFRIRLGLFRNGWFLLDRNPRAPKPRGSTVRRVEVLDLLQSGVGNFFENQLGDPVSLFHLKDVLAVQIEQHHAQRAPVVGVDDACSAVDPLLDGKSRPGRDPGVRPGGTGDAQIGVDDSPPARGDGRRSAGRQIKAGRQDGALGGKGRVLGELLDLEGGIHTFHIAVDIVVIVDIGRRRRKEQYRSRERREDALVVLAASVVAGGRSEREVRKEPNLVRKE
jgi:hypothetical protein